MRGPGRLVAAVLDEEAAEESILDEFRDFIDSINPEDFSS